MNRKDLEAFVPSEMAERAKASGIRKANRDLLSMVFLSIQAGAFIAIGAALAVGLAGIGTGLAQSNIGSAAIGAVAEDDKNFTNGLIFTAIPETIVIFGLVISALIIFVL